MPTITTRDDTTIFFKDWGPKSAQAIVLHHGWPLSGDDWDAQALFFLHKGYRVIAHDRRGHGRSSQGSDGHDMDQILGAYAQFRKHHESGAKKPFFIIARTVKGKGVSFMENQIGWHGVVPKPEERDRAITEIKTKLSKMKGA